MRKKTLKIYEKDKRQKDKNKNKKNYSLIFNVLMHP